MLNELVVRVWTWFHDEKGQDMIEYALITAGLSLAIMVAIIAGGIPLGFTGWAADIVAEIT
jgi:Flp pilus assembly pilin Flp